MCLSRELLRLTPVLSVSLLGTCIQGECSLLLHLDNLGFNCWSLKSKIACIHLLLYSFQCSYLYLLILPVPLLQPLSPTPPFAGPLGASTGASCSAQEFSGQGLILWFLRKPGRQWSDHTQSLAINCDSHGGSWVSTILMARPWPAVSLPNPASLPKPAQPHLRDKHGSAWNQDRRQHLRERLLSVPSRFSLVSRMLRVWECAAFCMWGESRASSRS